MKIKSQKYSSNETLLVITSIPAVEKKDGMRANFNAIGWHSEKTLNSLSQKREILVCAEKIKGESTTTIHKQIRVERVWSKTNIFSLFSVFRLIELYPNIRSVFVPFEFNVFGGIIPNVVLLLVLGILRLMGKQVTVEIHQVILDISKLVKHVPIKNQVLQAFFNVSLRFYYWSLGLVAHSIIVFEEELKNRLTPFINRHKIHTLSLAIEKKRTIPQKKAQTRLGIPRKKFVMMVFGFINGYKGIDWLIDTFASYKGKDIILMIAGGKNPYLAKDAHYKQFYASIVKAIGKDNRIVHTGFVPDKEVDTCFSACDLVVLPYEVFISASGPFSLALSYKKPIILSSALSHYAKSSDVKKALDQSNLPQKDLFFRLEKKSFFNLVHTYTSNTSARMKLANFSSVLGSYRTMNEVITMYDSLLFPNTQNIACSEVQPATCAPVLS